MKLGFIGTGNMGSALAIAAARSGQAGELLLANRSREKAERLAARIGPKAKVCSIRDAAAESEYIFLGVKPHMMAGVLDTIAPVLAKREGYFVLVTMAAGLTAEKIREMAGGSYPVIRIMPNTPVAVGEGMILYHSGSEVSEAQEENFLKLMDHAGRFSRIDERLIDAGSAVSGCGPAFACMFAGALADGGVACGLSRQQAIEYACQMMIGTARLILETNENPEKLKCDVCSPGGTTIEGVRALERQNFRSACMEAVTAAYEKTLKLR